MKKKQTLYNDFLGVETVHSEVDSKGGKRMKNPNQVNYIHVQLIIKEKKKVR